MIAKRFFLAACGLVIGSAAAQDHPAKAQIETVIAKEKENLLSLYRHLHANPELSFHEEKTSQRVAEEMRTIGLEVSEKVGGWGVVAVLKNGPGKTVLVRTDLDALPVREITGLPYSSKVKTKDDQGNEVSVMHACGHDMHMTCWVGVAKALMAAKGQWKGTLVFIGQPAEERGGGASAMLKEGLFEKFPKPEVCLALHCAAEIPAGSLGITPKGATASVDNIDIVVHGVGGHGAQPQATKDPIVIAAQLVLALQTIASREIHPLEPVVVTVGSIHGGTKHNIISDKVELQVTVRATSEETRYQVIESIKRICRGVGLTAGLPENLLPEVKDHDLYTPVLKNDDGVTQRLVGLFERTFGKDKMRERKPTMGGEDFSRYGMTQDRIPICMFWLGATPADKVLEAEKTNQQLPSLHSPFFRPDPEPTLETGVKAMSLAVLECLK